MDQDGLCSIDLIINNVCTYVICGLAINRIARGRMHCCVTVSTHVGFGKADHPLLKYNLCSAGLSAAKAMKSGLFN